MQLQYLWISLISVIVLLTAAGILSARLWCYKKQMDHMEKELELLLNKDTNYQLTSYVSVGKTEKIIAFLNGLMEKIREEKRMLAKENRIYRESITSISHDVRTPLTSAKGYLQMLQKDGLAEEKKAEYLKTVEKRLDHLTDMLDQLFEYARIEAGEMELEPEKLNGVNLFAETVAVFYEDFKEKGCEPEVILTQEPCRICVDRQAFVRILENLIRNALVHGTGEYQIQVIKEQKQMLIRISNLTENIEQSDMEQIFDRFYTMDSSRSLKTTGLGLAIVKRFTEQMQGSARAYLKGKRFTIEIRFPLTE